MWLTTKEALKVYGVSLDTLRRYDKDGKITTFRTVGNQRRYWNVYEKDETENDWELQEATMSKQNIKPDRLRQTILYAIVSTNNQKSSLNNQIEELKNFTVYCFLKCPNSYLDAICLAISAGRDTDTTAAIVGFYS